MHNGSAKWASMTEGQTKKCLTLIYNLKDRGLLVMKMELIVLKRLTKAFARFSQWPPVPQSHRVQTQFVKTRHTFWKLTVWSPEKNPHCSDLSELWPQNPDTGLESGLPAKPTVLLSPQGELWGKQRREMTDRQPRGKEKEGSPFALG